MLATPLLPFIVGTDERPSIAWHGDAPLIEAPQSRPGQLRKI
jgi:hypothetical protein